VVAEWYGTPGSYNGWGKGYVYLAGQLLAQYDNTVSPATTFFVHKDHLGSTRLLTKLDQSVEESLDFLPYGEPIGPSGTGTTHKFTGKERNSESGLDYFGARFYVSFTGRFLNADLPFIDQRPGNPQSWNLYPYARNNPINWTDPTGHAAADPNGLNPLPYESGMAMNAFGNFMCMRCEFFLVARDIQKAFAPFDAYRRCMQEVKTAIEFQKDMFAAYEKFGQIAKTVDELNALVVEEVGKKWGKLEVAEGVQHSVGG
jgi:RHS repeat-associated protein